MMMLEKIAEPYIRMQYAVSLDAVDNFVKNSSSSVFVLMIVDVIKKAKCSQRCMAQ